jgi:rhodanese-related sulfurtransferase
MIRSADYSVRVATMPPSHPLAKGSVTRSFDARDVWAAVQRGEAHLLDLRTRVERRRHGAPPGARPVSLFRSVLRPEGPPAVYLCQHAVRSKATLRKGAGEIRGGFAAWVRENLPVERT